jgi:lipoprotein-releasing system permease protein
VSYEARIGWRYVYSGNFDRTMFACALASLGLVGIGLYLVLTSGGSSPAGVVTLVLGMLSTAVFALLSFMSVFTSVSVLGVILGVSALTIVFAVTTGFEQQFREKVLGVNAHVIIMKNTDDFDDYRRVMKVAKGIDPEVLAVQPFIFTEMLVTRGRGALSGVAIKGVDPDRVGSVLDLGHHMDPGSHLSSLTDDVAPGALPPTLIGRELAKKLHAHLGDDVTLVIAAAGGGMWQSDSSVPRTAKFRVAGIFYSGFDEYDRRLMYITLKQAQRLVGHGDRVMGVELKIKDVDRAREIADKLSKKLGEPPFVIQDWYELNHSLFHALSIQKVVLVIILTLIITVATFNMVSALTMLVTDKTREIAILKSMGSTSGSVAKAFVVVGMTIGGIGTAVGVGIGLITCKVVSSYGYHLDPKVYLIDRLPIDVHAHEVVLVAIVTMAICALATLVPSIRASSLTPVEGLRYD